MLTFQEEESSTTYEIDQKFDYQDIEEHRYYYGSAEVPTDLTGDTPELDSIGTTTYNRIRLAYDNIKSDQYDPIQELTYTTTDANGNTTTEDLLSKVTVYESEDAWEAASTSTPKTKDIADGEAVFIKSTGELILSDSLSATLKSGKAQINITYTKQGFDEGEARPEYYYDCRDITKGTDAANRITYEKTEQKINYEISSGIMLAANTEASDVLDTSIGRDVTELIDVVSAAINAHDKVDKINNLMSTEQYADDESQEKLQAYLEVAQKEAAYADDNMQKTYSQYITNFDNYLDQVNIAHTNVGSMQNRLSLTKTRVENQKETVEELKTDNDNREISDIIIDYYAAYNAYTASLTAAAKINQQTLLNYI
jgi:flagellar hook-associated protein 3 FlgL